MLKLQNAFLTFILLIQISNKIKQIKNFQVMGNQVTQQQYAQIYYQQPQNFFMPEPIYQQPLAIIPEVNYDALIVQLRLIVQNVLKQFKTEGQDVQQFEKQLRKNNRQILRGENFQGRINQNRQVYGIAKYFGIKDRIYNLYFGQCINGSAVGRAINIKAYPTVVQNQDNTQTIILDKLNKQNYEAYLLQDWNPNPQNTRRGCMTKKSGIVSQFFKGQFKGPQLHRGKLVVKQNDKVKLQYIGEFKNSVIEGRGTLNVPNKYRFEGYFQRQKKQGIGREFDYIRHTEYIGEFENDKRNGYGELIYTNRNNVRLKGFWTDGIIKAGNGMYVRHDGVFIQAIGDDIQLL